MDNNFDKEIFTDEQLSEMNNRLRKQENLTVPENLLPEEIEKMLGSDEMWIPESGKDKKKSRKAMWRSFVAVAASLVIIFTSLFVFKPWEKTQQLVDTDLPITVSTPESYEHIEQRFAQYAADYKEYRKQNDFRLFGADQEIALEDNVVMGSSSTNTSVTAPSANGNTSNKGYGVTNEQVKGVSEADVIKNDGTYIYMVKPDNADWGSFYDELYAEVTNENGEVVEIKKETAGNPVLKYTCGISVVKPQSNGTLSEIGDIDIDTANEHGIYHMVIREIYVSGNRLVALLDCSVLRGVGEAEKNYRGFSYGGEKILTMAVCFDITDVKAPKEMWRIYQDGSYVSSRLVDKQLLFLSNYYINLDDDEQSVVDNCVPTSSVNNAAMKRIPCDCVVIGGQVESPSYLVASNVSIEDKETLKTQATLGAGSNVYCTTETLYATSTTYQDKGAAEFVFGVTQAKTNIFKFDIRNGGVIYRGSGCVDGTALNQFSMDEYNGFIRIATTSGSWGDSLSNYVWVLDENLKPVGQVSDIAKGERIKSVRFTGDTGYVVTFRQTDPLFVFDLSDPQKPQLKGELKIPGFSTYLHPVGENLLLGVGVDGTNDGQGNGMKVSLFDVSDPTKPLEIDKIELSGFDSPHRWTYIYSDAFYTHKALCWNAEENTMYIPYARQERVWASSNGERLSRSNTAGILAVKVNENEKKLSTEGAYTHPEGENSSGFTRVTYIGDVILGINCTSFEGAICSFNKKTQTETDHLVIK